MAKTSMAHRGNRLALAAEQRRALEAAADWPTFQEQLSAHSAFPLRAPGVEILQINVGKTCNMTCAHCHVDAGPDRRESMTRETAEACLRFLGQHPHVHTLDITGGAPELNPHFTLLVQGARRLGRHVIDRCNLTILQAPGFESLAEFLARWKVEIVASLPCYLEQNTDAQRGDGAFQTSIAALRQLNACGYGRSLEGIADAPRLTLVYNPVGAGLPPAQGPLEAAYRRELGQRYDVVFDRLFTITNMPISRYLDYLLSAGLYEPYMQRLIDAFNPAAIAGLMCRNTLSVGWDGRLYDCDFNQMLELGVSAEAPQTIFEAGERWLAERAVSVGRHCFGCTAGAGSGCQGAITAE